MQVSKFKCSPECPRVLSEIVVLSNVPSIPLVVSDLHCYYRVCVQAQHHVHLVPTSLHEGL